MIEIIGTVAGTIIVVLAVAWVGWQFYIVRRTNKRYGSYDD